MFTDVRLEREALPLSCGCTFLLGKKEKTKKPVGTKEGKPKMTSDTAGTTEDITQGTEGWKGGGGGAAPVCAFPPLQQRVGMCSGASPGVSPMLGQTALCSALWSAWN